MQRFQAGKQRVDFDNPGITISGYNSLENRPIVLIDYFNFELSLQSNFYNFGFNYCVGLPVL